MQPHTRTGKLHTMTRTDSEMSVRTASRLQMRIGSLKQRKAYIAETLEQLMGTTQWQ